MQNDKSDNKTYRITFQRSEWWTADIQAPTANAAKRALWNDTYDKSTEKWISGEDKAHRQSFRVESCVEVQDK